MIELNIVICEVFMKKKISVLLGSFILVSSLSSVAYSKPSSKEGKKIYDMNCAMCHGPKGAGDGAAAAALNPKPRNFTEGKFKYGSTDKDLFNLISKGKGPMPPWGSVLKENQIYDVIAYIRTLKKK
jgi:mono/diheme cytochrome c family protein